MFLKSCNQDLSRLSGEVTVLMRRGQCLAPQTGLAEGALRPGHCLSGGPHGLADALLYPSVPPLPARVTASPVRAGRTARSTPTSARP